MIYRTIPLQLLVLVLTLAGLSLAQTAVGAQQSSSDPIESCTPSSIPGKVPSLTGLNLAGAEFGTKHLPGTYGQNYVYPSTASVDYWLSKGFNSFRIPFRWERLQHEPYANFSSEELKHLSTLVNHIIDRGAWVILNPHNYSRYYKEVIGEKVDVEAFAEFWSRLAKQFPHERIIYGLMNEPHSMSSELWRDNANTAIAAIRATGAENLIFVPGNAWTGAHSWLADWYGTPNGTVMQEIRDPANNFAFEVHQYLDGNSSGTSGECVNTTIGSKRLVAFTDWLRQHNHKGYIGEFAGGPSATCAEAIDDMLSYMDKNSDVWMGWSWWAGGPWWGNYYFSIEPKNNVDDPRVKILQEYTSP